MFKKISGVLTATATVIGSAVSSFADTGITLDFSTVTTAVTSQLNPAVAAALPIGGSLLAVGIAWKLYRRFTK